MKKGDRKMPLALANAGDALVVERISGAPDVKKHLEDLGFVTGAEIEVVQAQKGNLIIALKGSRLAITSEMARKIMVRPKNGA